MAVIVPDSCLRVNFSAFLNDLAGLFFHSHLQSFLFGDAVFHRGVALCRKSMTAQGTWYWAIQRIGSKLTLEERQIQQT